MRFFGSSGIRDVVTLDFLRLTHEAGLATGNMCGSVIVGCDTRTSSDSMKYAFISGLLAAGADARDAGMVTTPTLAFASRNFDAGAMITASHNPEEYNGIKLLNPNGSAFSGAQRARVEQMLSDKSFKIASWQEMKACRAYRDAVEQHTARILADFPVKLKVKVAVDCGCGAASATTPELLRRLGCEVVTLNCEPGGRFPRGSEPTEDSLKGLARLVKDSGADLGIAHDGDADRVVAIDDRGRFVPGDKLIVLLAREEGAKKLVSTVDASMLLEEAGFEVTRTRVGDAFVSEALAMGGDFGAEPAGCFIYPRISFCPDAIYAAARIARLAAEHRISALVDQLPSFPILRGSIAGDRAAMLRLENTLKNKYSSVDTTDGLKVGFSDGWLLIRASGTEAKVRITTEAKTEARCKEIYDLGTRLVRESMAAVGLPR